MTEWVTNDPEWLVVIPCIGPQWLIEDCLDSMDNPHTAVLVIDNSAHGLRLPSFVESIVPDGNLGVAMSWNLGLEYGAKWTLLLSASMMFRKGLDNFIRYASSIVDPYGARCGTHGFHAFVLGHKLVEEIGVFDDRFYPCEYEDTDYLRRMKLAGRSYESLPDIGGLDLVCHGNSIAGKLGLVERSDIPAKFYVAKWGGPPGHETATTPFW